MRCVLASILTLAGDCMRLHSRLVARSVWSKHPAAELTVMNWPPASVHSGHSCPEGSPLPPAGGDSRPVIQLIRARRV